MNTRYIVFLVFGVALSAHAQNGPLLICDQPEYDFGALVNTQTVQHTFLLRNAGGAPAIISRVFTACNCTTASVIRTVIPSGETEPLSVGLQLIGRSGPQARPIYVRWNNMSGMPLRFLLSGTSLAEIEVLPNRLLFHKSTTTVTREVRVYSHITNQSIHVTGAACSDTSFTARIETNIPGREYRIRVDDITPDVRETSTALLRVTTDHPGYCYSSFDIPLKRIRRHGNATSDVHMVITPDLQLSFVTNYNDAADTPLLTIAPSNVSFGTVAPTGDISRSARLSFSHVNPAFHVTGATCVDNRFTANVETLADGREYMIDIHALEPRVTGAVAAVVTVATDHPQYSLIDIPVYMRVQESSPP